MAHLYELVNKTSTNVISVTIEVNVAAIVTGLLSFR